MFFDQRLLLAFRGPILAFFLGQHWRQPTFSLIGPWVSRHRFLAVLSCWIQEIQKYELLMNYRFVNYQPILTQTHTGFVAYHSHFRNTKILPSGNLSVCEVSAELKKHSCIIQHPSSRYSELPRWVSQSLGQSAHGQVNINPHWFCRAAFCIYKILTYN